ncbi:MAG: hypothetical protein EB120_10610 [Proteobacteria bacterium]|nr:hypothetical protein [Pseudomonadota bacterium]
MGLAALALISCGQRQKVNLTAETGASFNSSSSVSGPNLNFESAPRALGTTTTFNSGTTGSPNATGNTANIASTGYTQTGYPVNSQDYWGNIIPPTPQQCADAYNRYYRYASNFEPALAGLADCLNKAIIGQNSQYSQGYRALIGN